MTLFRTVAPAVEPVTLVAVKEQLRIAHSSEDDFLLGLIAAAREEVEAATGMALINQSWRLVMDDWPPHDTVLLRRTPVRAIVGVTVFDTEGAGSVVDPGAYQLDSASKPARLLLEKRPTVGLPINGIEIDFTAGHGEAGTDVPDLLRRAVTMLVAHWYEFRAVYSAADQPVSLPAGYQRLIDRYRTPRL